MTLLPSINYALGYGRDYKSVEFKQRLCSLPRCLKKVEGKIRQFLSFPAEIELLQLTSPQVIIRGRNEHLLKRSLQDSDAKKEG